MDHVTSAHDMARRAGGVLVPTMGALHEGHAALIRRARAAADELGRGVPVVVSVFVNPTQFEEPSDFSRYPRTIEADAALAHDCGADCLFVPDVETVYPPGQPPPVPPLPDAATKPGLEDRFRPGHFAGVCQVVARLFELVRPRAAVFGEKDWQQAQVVRAVAGAVEIILRETVREPDGLAMSSRNRFLVGADRQRAASLFAALGAAGGQATAPRAERTMLDVLERAGVRAEYAVIRDAQTLMTPVEGRPRRALIAARLGGVRLIDNAPWTPA